MTRQRKRARAYRDATMGRFNTALQEELSNNVALEVQLPDAFARSVIGSVARGAVGLPELLAAHPPDTAIGRALRLTRLQAAVSLGEPSLVYKAIRNARMGEYAIEECVCAARAVYHCARSSTARGLRKWLISQSVQHVADAFQRESTLIRAIKWGKPMEVRRLLEDGVTSNSYVKSPLTAGDDITLLALAILAGSPEKTAALLEFGANAFGVRRPNPHSSESTYTSLHFIAEATRQPNLNRNGPIWREIVSMLIRHGVDINAVDESGSTALHYMALHDHFHDRLRFLINQGANPDIAVAPDFWFAVDSAAWNSAGKNFVYLLGLQSNPGQHAHKSARLLTRVGQSWGWQVEIPRLLAAGVDVDAVNEEGKTCLQVTLDQAEQHFQSPLEFPWNNKPTIDAWIAFGAKVKPAMLLMYPPMPNASMSIGGALRMSRVDFILDLNEPLTTLRFLQHIAQGADGAKRQIADIGFWADSDSMHSEQMCRFWLAGYTAQGALNAMGVQAYPPSRFSLEMHPFDSPKRTKGMPHLYVVQPTKKPKANLAITEPSRPYDLSIELENLLHGRHNVGDAEGLEHALLRAVRTGSTKLVTKLLEQGASPNRPSDPQEAWSVLGIAVMRGDLAIVSALLEFGADAHDVLYESHTDEPLGANALHVLCGCMDADSRQLYFSTPDLLNWQAIADLLVRHGADVNAHALLQWKGDTPLIAAIYNGLALEKCQFLVKAGAEINACSATGADRNAINTAIQQRAIEVVDLLLEAGVPIDGLPMQICSPIHCIARSSPAFGVWRHMLPALVDRGADVNANDTVFWPPLKYVTREAQSAIRKIKTEVKGLPMWERRYQVANVVSAACERIHAWIASGATPPPSLLGTHRRGTIIGDALRSSALSSAMHCESEWFLLHALKDASLSHATFSQLKLDAAALQRAGREENHFLLESWLTGAAASELAGMVPGRL